MKKLYTIIPIFIILFLFVELRAQDVTLNSQDEVDAFIGTSVSGDLVISGDDIEDLSQLSTLTNITAALHIKDNPNLKSLSGLQNLTSIGNDLVIRNNSLLQNLSGLDNLSYIGANLYIKYNSALTNLIGLESLDKIRWNIEIQFNSSLLSLNGLSSITSFGDISITYNDALINCSGLEHLTSVNGLSIAHNPSLINFVGLESLTTVSSSLNIIGNSSLNSFKGLEDLNFIGGDLLIAENPKIVDLSELESLQSIGYVLWVYLNSSLENLIGLENLGEVGRRIMINDNPLLESFCGLYNILSSGKIGDGILVISGNLANPTAEEILANGVCNRPKMISYHIVLPDCNDEANPTIISNGLITEGESYVFPAFTLPPEYTYFQNYYNLLVNAEFGIPLGALNEDIVLSINLQDVCSNGQIDNLDTEDILELLFLNIKIIGSESGEVNPLEYYNFNDGKEAYLKIPIAAINSLIDFLNFDIDQLIPFFTVNNLKPDFSGIRKEVDENFYTIYFEHLSEVRLGVKSTITATDELEDGIPTEYSLNQNYPNPFNPISTITYSLPKQVLVSLKLYDILGTEKITLVDEVKSSGTYKVEINGEYLSSGVYFYRIQAGNFVDTKKMILVK